MISIVLIPNSPHTIILNGFDRSGSSAISRTLAKHSDIELFMQPFNSGPVREKMYKRWTDSIATKEDVSFFKGLEKGSLKREYIKSHWFDTHSTVRDFVPNRIHLVKTTLNHFLIEWCQSRFPGIHQWSIWRDPWDILRSLIRNDFIGEWYADAFEQTAQTVQTTELLSPFVDFIPRLNNPQSKAAFLIGVRSYFLFSNTEQEKVIFYDEFKTDPLKSLSSFFKTYSLEEHVLESNDDLNIIGVYEASTLPMTELVDIENVEVISSIFAVLTDMLKIKFPERGFRS